MARTDRYLFVAKPVGERETTETFVGICIFLHLPITLVHDIHTHTHMSTVWYRLT